MTNSFIGQVGDVNNHKQDFEKLHVCFCVFKNRCLLAQLRGGEGVSGVNGHDENIGI